MFLNIMNEIDLLLATKDDVDVIHEMQNRAFMPLYENGLSYSAFQIAFINKR